MHGEDCKTLIASLEDGYTKIPNLLLEALILSELNRAQLAACLFILRRTHGWNREDDAVALSELAAGCGCSVSYASRQVQALVRQRVVRRVASSSGQTSVYALNPQVSEWDRDCFRPEELEENRARGLYCHRGCLPVRGLRPGADEALNQEAKGPPHLEANAGLLTGVGVRSASALEPPSLEPVRKKGLKKEKKREIYGEDSPEFELAHFLLSQILLHLPGLKRPDLQRWAEEVERMLRLDRRPAEEVKAVIRFAQNDPFWRSNILSPAKLRRQYDMLNGKRLAARGAGSAGGKRLYGSEPGQWEEADEYKGFFS